MTEATLTAEEMRAAHQIYDRIYTTFHQMWTALLLLDACRTGELPESVADHGEVRDMVLARALQMANETSEDDLTDLRYILTKQSPSTVREIVAKAHKEDATSLQYEGGGS